MTLIQQGLTISGLGVVITFLALGLLIGVIYLLKWIFRVIPADVDLAEIEPLRMARERAVAIAVAAWYLDNKRARSLGERLTRKRGNWWQHG
jgi:Na+-transporting methylmalonyl-CoA/oxaloacetate decarboxylase gamma subunit